MSTKMHKCSGSGTEQRELPLFLEERDKGDIVVRRTHIAFVRTTEPTSRFQWFKAIHEAFSSHNWIIGFAMFTSIPLLWWIAAANIHNTEIIVEVLAILGGLLGVHLWTKNPGKRKQKNPATVRKRAP